MITPGIAVGGLDADRVAAVLSEAMAAADQGYSAGVWSWRCTASTIELWGKLPAPTDPVHREVMLAGGAALLNLRILIRAQGVHPAVRMLPQAASPDLIAIARPEGSRPVTAEDRALADAVLFPRAGPFTSAEVIDQAALISELRRAAKMEQAWLALLPPPIPASGRGASEAPRCEPTGEPVWVVIGTVLDGAAARLQAGQATQRVLLAVAGRSVPARVAAEVLRAPADRQDLRERIGGGIWPQAVLRLG